MGLIITTHNKDGTTSRTTSKAMYESRQKKEELEKCGTGMTLKERNMIRKIRSGLVEAHNSCVFKTNQTPFKIAIDRINMLLDI